MRMVGPLPCAGANSGGCAAKGLAMEEHSGRDPRPGGGPIADPALRNWRRLDVATVDGGSELALWQRDDMFVIRVDGRELMASRVHGSEDAMARYGCARLSEARAPAVLVGGLGLGYTLAATLRVLPASATVVVVERVPAVVEWNRGALGPLAGRPLDDPRVQLKVADVADVLQQDPGRYDAILLDVDNGPYSLSLAKNKGLYSWGGVKTTLRALRPDGILVIWSAAPDVGFQQQLRRMHLNAKMQVVGERGGKRGRKHFLHIIQA